MIFNPSLTDPQTNPTTTVTVGAPFSTLTTPGGGISLQGGGGGAQAVFQAAVQARMGQFRFWGSMVGMAVRHRVKAGLNMPGIVWKAMSMAPVGRKDLGSVDSAFARMLAEMETLSPQQVRMRKDY